MIESMVSVYSEVSPWALLWLLLAAFIAGYIDTLVGGGGLITIPALLLAGIPPIQALGTNKLQACAGSGTATLTLILKGKLSFKQLRLGMVTAFIGALFGAVVVQYINAEVLAFVVPIVIVLIALYFLLVPKQRVGGGKPKVSVMTHRLTAVPTVGFYDGMFGPATGSFFVLAGVSLRGQGIVESSMVAKALNFASNIASLTVFIWYGQVVFVLGAMMMLGQFVGASIGARSLMKIDQEMLRFLVVGMCVTILVVWFVNR
ncbi:MAG: TSUP family transporter [Gammaproteobacteria bacterium]|nr:TSUP family transporter [Gammaproteobacteria bacterium]